MIVIASPQIVTAIGMNGTLLNGESNAESAASTTKITRAMMPLLAAYFCNDSVILKNVSCSAGENKKSTAMPMMTTMPTMYLRWNISTYYKGSLG